MAERRAAALEDGDPAEIARATLALNEQTELNYDERNPESVERKYDLLSAALEQGIAEEDIPQIAYHPLELAAVRDVSATFGPLLRRR